MLAKGRLLGIQFETLFEHGLYLQLGRHGDETAYQVRDIFRRAGCPLLFDSPTNQQFPILSAAAYAKLEDVYKRQVRNLDAIFQKQLLIVLLALGH